LQVSNSKFQIPSFKFQGLPFEDLQTGIYLAWNLLRLGIWNLVLGALSA